MKKGIYFEWWIRLLLRCEALRAVSTAVSLCSFGIFAVYISPALKSPCVALHVCETHRITFVQLNKLREERVGMSTEIGLLKRGAIQTRLQASVSQREVNLAATDQVRSLLNYILPFFFDHR